MTTPKTSPAPGIFQASLLVFGLTAFGQVLGLGREATYAGVFGSSALFDRMTVVLNLVMMVQSIFTAASLFVLPKLGAGLAAGDRARFERQAAGIWYALISVTGVVTAVLFVGAEVVVGGVAPGLGREGIHEAAQLMRALLPALFLANTAQWLKCVLNIHDRYGPAALESLFFNMSVIGSVLASAVIFDSAHPLSIVIGFYASYFLFIASCWQGIRGFFALRPAWEGSAIRGMIPQLVVVLLAKTLMAASSALLLSYASDLGSGNLSHFGYAQRLLVFTMGNMVNSVLVVFTARTARNFPLTGNEGIAANLRVVMPFFVFVAAMVAVGLSYNAEGVIALALQRGAFGEESVAAVSAIIPYFFPWLFFFPLTNLFQRAIGIKELFHYNLVIAAFALGLVATICPVLATRLGLSGLALASSIHMATIGSLSAIALWYQGIPVITRPVLRAACEAIVGGAVLWAAIAAVGERPYIRLAVTGVVTVALVGWVLLRWRALNRRAASTS